MRLRGLRLLWRLGVRDLWPAGVESRLLDRPGMAFVSILILLCLILSLRWIDKDVSLGASIGGAEKKRTYEGDKRRCWKTEFRRSCSFPSSSKMAWKGM